MKHFTTAIYSSTDRNGKFKKYDALLRTFPNSTMVTDQSYQGADLAILYSWIKENTSGTENKLSEGKMKANTYKKYIIDSQKKSSNHTMAIDNSLFVYKDQTYQHNYLRFSIDDVFANTGYYLDREVEASRWIDIQRNLGIQVKPWRTTGNHVLVCLQRNNGFSFNQEDGVPKWMTTVLNELLRVTDRPIVIRMHPGDTGASSEIKKAVDRVINDKMRRTIKSSVRSKYLVRNTPAYGLVRSFPNAVRLPVPRPTITISTNRRIEDDLNNAWCCVTYNSSPSTVSAIEGIPVFVLDPVPQKSQAYPVCNTDLNQIEYPMMPDNRHEWLERLAMSHFSYEDIENGLLYKAVAKFFEEKDAGV
jgi:hypothetical protein